MRLSTSGSTTGRLTAYVPSRLSSTQATFSVEQEPFCKRRRVNLEAESREARAHADLPKYFTFSDGITLCYEKGHISHFCQEQLLFTEVDDEESTVMEEMTEEDKTKSLIRHIDQLQESCRHTIGELVLVGLRVDKQEGCLDWLGKEMTEGDNVESR